MIQSSPTETVNACLAAAAHGLAWLLDQQTAAGSWRQLEIEVFDAYYKGGWALAVSGQPAAAHRLLAHVQRAFLTAEGDFEPRAALLHTDVARLYASSYVILAAQKLDRYEIAAPAVPLSAEPTGSRPRRLLLRQDAGRREAPLGFHVDGDVRRRVCWPPGRRSERPWPATACCGWSRCNRRCSQRRGVSSPPWTQAGRLQVDFPPEAAVWRVVEAGQTGQRWFAVGLPFAFAVLLHQATGEPRFKHLADELFAFQSPRP